MQDMLELACRLLLGEQFVNIMMCFKTVLTSRLLALDAESLKLHSSFTYCVFGTLSEMFLLDK